MVFGHIVSSPRGSLSPKQSLDLANIFLENADREQDPDLILVLCHEAEVSLSQTKKTAKYAEDQTMRHGIAVTYLGLGRLLASRGYQKEAQGIYKKAEKLGAKVQDHGQQDSLDFRTNAYQTKETPVSTVDTLPIQSSPSDYKRKRQSVIAIVSPSIFTENLRPPTVVTQLPDSDGRLISTPQLACCLGLLKNSHSIDDVLEPAARIWLQATENDEDEQERLKGLSMDVIRMFKKEEIKDAKVVAEVVCLGPVL
ncbi:hypothetical protein B0O80DRAFT_484544, partial [Mortierella sp. GBAus27b]